MSKQPMTAPVIVAEGEYEYLLENGNTISKEFYDNMWHKKKGIIIPGAYHNIGRQIPNELKNKKV